MHVGHFQVLLTVSGGTRQVGAHVARLATRVPSRESESATMLNQAAREGPAQAHKDQHTETATWGTPMHVCFFCFSFINVVSTGYVNFFCQHPQIVSGTEDDLKSLSHYKNTTNVIIVLVLISKLNECNI